MGEPMRTDRKAAAGKFCVWVEGTDGSDYRIPDDFDEENDARKAAQALLEADRGRVHRILVYDGMGMFTWMLARRD